jgi:hypothetical protein
MIHPRLPKDCRTILKTERTINIQELENGKFHHIGIKFSLNAYLKTFDVIPDEIKFDIFVDGLPLFKNTKCNDLWVILIGILSTNIVLPVSIFFGSGKPGDF